MTVQTETAGTPADPATHILQVACHLFSQHGYKAVGMRRLAEQVGVQPGSLYHHIESKQALLCELIENYETRYLHVIRALVSKPIPNSLQLANELWAAMAAFVTQHAGAARLAHNESFNLSLEQSERIDSIRQMRQAELRRLLIVNRMFRPNDVAALDVVEALCGIIECIASMSAGNVGGPRKLIEMQLRELMVKTLHKPKRSRLCTRSRDTESTPLERGPGNT